MEVEGDTPRKFHKRPSVESVSYHSRVLQDGCISSSDLEDSLNMRQQHALNMLGLMREMHSKQVLCDVSLVVQGQTIPAHRLVLASCSPYFNAMFTSNLKECHEKTVTLCEHDAEAITEVVKFAYSGKLDLTEKNVQAILNAASLLQIEPIISTCCEFLKTQLHPSNCLGIQSFADSHGCFDLQQAAESFARQNFTKVATQEEFSQLTAKELIKLIEHDSLNVTREEEVYKAVMNWLKHDWEARKQHIGDIFEYVRLPLLSWEFLTSQVVQDKITDLSERCHRFFDEARRFHASEYYPGLHWEVNVRTIPRDSFKQCQYIYVIGGETRPSRNTLCSLERFHPVLNNWVSLPPMQISRRGVGTVTYENKIFAVGGANESPLRDVESFNIQTETWWSVAPMHTPRSSVAAATVRGKLYALGGYDGFTSVATAEEYDPHANEWTTIADMNTCRSMAAAVAYEGCIYVIGGYSGSSDLSSVECYNPMRKEWQNVTSMTSPRSMMAAAVLNEKIYVVGGCGMSGSLSEVEYYDPNEKMWYQVRSMCNPRSGLGLASINHKLYALGGFNGSTNLETVERYDEVEDSWKVVSNMPAAIYRFGCCTGR